MLEFLDQCVDAPDLTAQLYFAIHWTFDDDGVGHANGVEPRDTAVSTELSDEELTAITDCIKTYVDAHPISFVRTQAWMVAVTFPIDRHPLVRLAREIQENGENADVSDLGSAP